jgi:hypothetical protein
MKRMPWVPHLPVVTPAAVMRELLREATQVLLRAAMLGHLQQIWVAEA